MSLYLGNALISGVTTPIDGSIAIGQIISSIIPLNDAGLHLLDGSLISGSGSYAAFVTYIAGLVNSYPSAFTTESAWQNTVSSKGVCGKFVYNSTNNTVRLPKITGFIEGTTDTTALGELINAGLPNITGETYSTNSSAASHYANTYRGVFRGRNTTGYSYYGGNPVSSSDTNVGISFDASRSNSIYGASSTVQPQSIKVLYYIVIATNTKTDVQVDIDEIATDLNGKADTDLSNVTDSGKILLSSMGMPSNRYTDLTLGASGSTYTAPANGYVFFSKMGNQGQSVILNNQQNKMRVQSYIGSNNNWSGIIMPIRKNERFNVEYTASGNTKYFRFIYAEGSKSD